MASHLIDVTQLQTAIRLVVRGFGSHEAEVEAVAANLIEANLTGHDSHGIGMLPRYVEAYQQRGLVPNQHVRTVLDAGALLTRRRRRLRPGHRPRSDGSLGSRARCGERAASSRWETHTIWVALARGLNKRRRQAWSRCTSSTSSRAASSRHMEAPTHALAPTHLPPAFR